MYHSSITFLAWNLSIAGSPKKWRNKPKRMICNMIRPKEEICEAIFPMRTGRERYGDGNLKRIMIKLYHFIQLHKKRGTAAGFFKNLIAHFGDNSISIIGY